MMEAQLAELNGIVDVAVVGIVNDQGVLVPNVFFVKASNSTMNKKIILDFLKGTVNLLLSVLPLAKQDLCLTEDSVHSIEKIPRLQSGKIRRVALANFEPVSSQPFVVI